MRGPGFEDADKDRGNETREAVQGRNNRKGHTLLLNELATSISISIGYEIWLKLVLALEINVLEVDGRIAAFVKTTTSDKPIAIVMVEIGVRSEECKIETSDKVKTVETVKVDTIVSADGQGSVSVTVH